MAGLVRMKMSGVLLREALNLPDSVHVWKVEQSDEDLKHDLVTLVLMSPEFAETPEASDVPDVTPVITRHAERIVWKFGDKEIE